VLWRRSRSSKQNYRIGTLKIVLVELQVVKQKINNMEKHNKDLENIRVERDYLHAELKDTLNVEHNKLQRDHKNMEHSLLKQ
jgi:hypothetical protein